MAWNLNMNHLIKPLFNHQIIMKKRIEIGCNDAHGQSFFVNQLRISPNTIKLIRHIGISRVFLQNNVKTNRYIVNKVSERSNNLICHNITNISQICYFPFMYVFFSARLGLGIKFRTNSLISVFKALEKYRSFHKSIVSEKNFFWKTNFTKLVSLTIIDFKNSLLKIDLLIRNIFNTDFVFFNSLKLLFLLPYKPLNLLLYLPSEEYRKKRKSFFWDGGKFLDMFSKTKKNTFPPIQWLTIILLTTVIYRTHSKFSLSKNTSHVVNMMYKHIDNLALDYNKNSTNHILYNQSTFLNSDLYNLNWYTRIQNNPTRFNTKFISNIIDNWILSTDKDNVFPTHIQYQNKLITQNPYLNNHIKCSLYNSKSICQIKSVFIEIHFNFIQRIIKNIHKLILGILAKESESKRLTIHSVPNNGVNVLDNTKLHIYRFCHKWFTYVLQNMNVIKHNVRTNRQSISQMLNSEIQISRKKSIDIKLIWIIPLLNSTHESLRYKMEQLEPSYNKYNHIWKVKTWIGNIAFTKYSLHELIYSLIESLELVVSESNVSLISEINKDYNNFYLRHKIIKKCDTNDLFVPQTLKKDFSNFKNTTQYFLRLLKEKGWHHLLNLLVPQKQTNTKSIHILSNVIDLALYEQMQAEIKSITEPISWFDNAMIIPSIELKLNQKTLELTKLLNLQEFSLLTNKDDVVFLISNSQTISNLTNKLEISVLQKKVNIFNSNNDLNLHDLFANENFGDEKLSLINFKDNSFTNLQKLVRSNNLNLFQNYKGWLLTSQWWILLKETLTKTVPFVSQNAYDSIKSLFLSSLRKPVIFPRNVSFEFLKNITISNHLFVQFNTINNVKQESLNRFVKNINIQAGSFHVFYVKAYEGKLLGWAITIYVLSFFVFLQYLFFWNILEFTHYWNTPSFRREKALLSNNKRFKKRLRSKSKRAPIIDKKQVAAITMLPPTRSVPSSFLKQPKFDLSSVPILSLSFIKKVLDTSFSEWIDNITDPMTILIVDEDADQITDEIDTAIDKIWLKLDKTKNWLELNTEIVDGLEFHILEQLNKTYSFFSSQLKTRNKVNDLHYSRNICFAGYSFRGNLNQSVLCSSINFLKNVYPNNPNMLLCPRHKSTPSLLRYFNLEYKGLFLIGPNESGKSNLIKNLANTANIPLIQITIDQFLSSYVDEDDGFEMFVRSLERISVIFDLISMLGSCVVWLSDLEILKKYTERLMDIKPLVVCAFLKTMQHQLSENLPDNMHFIATSNNIRTTDPTILLSSNFDRLVFFQILDKSQRETNLFKLFYAHNLNLKHKLSLKKIADNTVRYTWIDFEALLNEMRLIARTEDISVVDNEIATLALHQHYFSSNSITTILSSLQKEPNALLLHILLNKVLSKSISIWCMQKSIHYKIGQAIIQYFVKNKISNSIFSLRAYPNSKIWKRKFWYLATGYLELPLNNSIITESIVLPYVLTCLGGSAAQDAWMVSVNNITENIFTVDLEIEQDNKLALRLFRSLFSELASNDIYENLYYKNNLLPNFGFTHYPFSFDVYNYKKSHILNTDLNISYVLDENTLLSKWDVKLNQNPGEKLISCSNRTTLLDVSSKPPFNIIVKQEEEDINILPDIIVPKSVKRTKFDFPYKTRFWSKELEGTDIYRKYNKSSNFLLVSTPLMECHPSTHSSVLFIKKEIVFNEINPQYFGCLLSCYKNVYVSRDAMVMLYFVHLREEFELHFLRSLHWLRQDLDMESVRIKRRKSKKVSLKEETEKKEEKEKPLESTNPLQFFELAIDMNIEWRHSYVYPLVLFSEGNLLAKHLPHANVFYPHPQKTFHNQHFREIVFQEKCLYGTFLEIYHYLFHFYLLRNARLMQLKTLLLKKGVLYRSNLVI